MKRFRARRQPRGERGGGEGTPNRIAVTNVFSDDNRGGAAITMASVDTLRDAFPASTVSLIAVGSDPDRLTESHRHTRARFPGIELLPAPLQVRRGRLGGLRAFFSSLVVLATPEKRGRSASLDRLADADMIVSKGGHVFIEREGLRGVLSLWMTVWPLLIGWRRRVPSIVFCSSVGPFHSRSSRFVNGFVLRRVSLVLARDPLSYSEARNIGVPADRVAEVPDVVFRTPPPSSDESTAVATRLGFDEVTFGAVTFRAVPSRSATRLFAQNVAATLKKVLDDGIVERVAVVVQVDGRTASDRSASAHMVELMNDPRVVLVDADLSPSELIAFYGAASFVLGSRLHSTIFSMVAGTPALSLAIRGAKARGVYASLGLADMVVDYDDLDPGQAAGHIAAIVEQGEGLRERIRQAVRQARDRTSAYPELLERPRRATAG